MTKNVGSVDRVLRVILGLSLLGWALLGPASNYSWLGFIGIVPLLTAAISWCPLYALLGINTCPAKRI